MTLAARSDNGPTPPPRLDGTPSYFMFPKVEADAIMRTSASYRADLRQVVARSDAPLMEYKTNLALGVYVDDCGVIPRFDAYQVALSKHQADQLGYLPPTGDERFCREMARLAFDDSSDRSKNVISIQALGGTGSVHMAAEFLSMWFQKSEIARNAAFSNPSWPNHSSIFKKNGFNLTEIPHVDDSGQTYAASAVIESVLKLPRHCVLVLQPCGHNPTGIDPSTQQWRELLEEIAAKRPDLFLLFDFAYQGFGTGVATDAYPIRLAYDLGLAVLVGHSGSKMFAAYGLRVAALHIACPDIQEREAVRTTVATLIARPEYSNPPITALPLGSMLEDENLRKQWIGELDRQRARMEANRMQIVHQLSELGFEDQFKFVLRQRGMFSCLAFTPAQTNDLVTQGVYMAPGGRMVFPALNSKNTNFVARAISAMLRKRVH